MNSRARAFDRIRCFLREMEQTVALPESGERIGQYRILDKIDQGGMGAVFRALDEVLDRQVALKVMLGCDQLARFEQEASMAAQLHHPDIVKLLDWGVHEIDPDQPAIPYLVLELRAGGNLAQALDGLTSDAGAAILLRVALALEHAHQRGIVHRDLKPSNILLGPDGNPAICDFGLACLVGHGASQQTATGQALGTPDYMAPEQVQGRRDQIGPATDIWALGVLLYQLLCDRLPFEGETPAERFEAICYGELPPVPPGQLGRVCIKALRKEPSRRHASATEFADEIARCLSGSARRPRRARLVVGGVAMLLLAAGVYQLIGTRGTGRSPEPIPAVGPTRPGTGLGALRSSIMKYPAYRYLHEPRLETQRPALVRTVGRLRALSRKPDASQELWALLGMGEYFLGREPAAVEALSRASQLDPADGGSAYYLGRLYLDRALRDRWLISPGEQWLVRRYRENVRKALVCFKRPVGSWSGGRPVERMVAQAYRALVADDREGALNLCRGGRKRFADQPGNEEFWMIECWLHPGAERIACLDRLLSRRPQDALAHFVRGGTHHLMRNLDEALRDYARAIALDPRMELAYNARASCLIARGELEAALGDLERATALNPEFARAYSTRALVRFKLGLEGPALADCSRAIELNSQLAAAYTNRGVILIRQGDLPRAKVDLDRAVALDPRDPTHYQNRARVHEASGRTLQAVADLTRVLGLVPGDAQALYHRGRLLLAAGKLARARGDLLRYRVKRPGDWRGASRLGQVLARLGERPEARQVLSLARRLASPSARADLTRQLERLDQD